MGPWRHRSLRRGSEYSAYIRSIEWLGEQGRVFGGVAVGETAMSDTDPGS